MKISKKITIAIMFLIAFFTWAILFSNYSDKKEVKDKAIYFSKVSYTISGKMGSYRPLGGIVYLLEIDVDSITIPKNYLSKKDDFIGLYSKKPNKVYLNAYLESGECNTFKEIRNDTLPYVKINSSKKIIQYIGKTISTEELRYFNLYKNYLSEIETNEMIRF